MPRPRASVLLVPCLLLLAACGLGGGRDVERKPGSALWLDPASGPVSREQLRDLAALGVDEVFLVAGDLSWEGGEPVLESLWRDLRVPDRTPATLVVRGAAAPVEPSSRGVETLAAQLQELRLEAQRRGLLPVGLHLDLELAGADGSPPGVAGGQEPLEILVSWVEPLASRLGNGMPLSVTLPRGYLGESGARDLARVADALLVFLYGQKPRETEDPGAWELATVEQGLRRLEELGEDYLVGVVTLGRLQRQGGSGEATTLAGLRRLLDRSGLETTFGFSLEGIDRRVYTFEARGPVRFGPWRLERGERLEASILGAEHVVRLLDRLDAMAPEHHLGQVWYRPPRAEEGLALTVPNLIGALSPEPPEPRLLARRSGEPGGRRLRVRLTNAGSQATELARTGSNYLELTLPRGSFAAAEAGGFDRYDLLDSTTGRRSLRDPDVVRFFVSFLDAGESVETGPVVVAGARAEEVELGGTFRLPDGTQVEVGEAPVEAEPEASRRGSTKGGR